MTGSDVLDVSSFFSDFQSYVPPEKLYGKSDNRFGITVKSCSGASGGNAVAKPKTGFFSVFLTKTKMMHTSVGF